MEPAAKNHWANVELASGDLEAGAIDRAMDGLGDLSVQVLGIRELIARYEACHFKQGQHYGHVLESIAALRPTIDAETIGAHHVRHGDASVAHDTTGRSQVGQRYVHALEAWLDAESLAMGVPKNETAARVWAWLGPRDSNKDKLVRMLVDRLLYRRLDEYLAGELSELDYQVLRTDICHHAFPRNLERVVQAIGVLQPLENFEGCGICSAEVTDSVRTQFDQLRGWLAAKEPDNDLHLGDRTPTRRWLVMSLAKTLKEQAHLENPVPGIHA